MGPELLFFDQLLCFESMQLNIDKPEEGENFVFQL